MCELHALLAVAGAIFSNGIAKHLVKQEQCDVIDEYGWTGQRSGSGLSDIASAALGVFASSDRF
jgi:hypothetical protein